jgi:hypothetical protein
MITDEMVEVAVDGAVKALWSAPDNAPAQATLIRAALTAVLPMIRAAALEEAALVADYGAQRAYRDFHDRKLAEGAQVMALEIAEAIRALKGASHE